MSSPPLAALAIRPPEQQNPLSAVEAIYRLRAMGNQQQLQQQQLQNEQLQNQTQQFALQQQQAGMKAMQQWDGKDYDDLPGLLQKNGASLNTVMQAKTSILKYRQDLAGYTKDQLANTKAQNDAFRGLLDPVKTPEDFQQALSSAVQQGYVNPQQAQAMTFDHLDAIKKSLLGHEQLISDAEKQAQTTEAANRGAESAAQAQKLQLEMNPQNPADKEFKEQKYQGILQQIQAKQPVSAADMVWAKSYEDSQAKTTSQSDSLGVMSTNTSKPSGLSAAGAYRGTVSGGGGTPGGESPREGTIDMIGQYRMAPAIMSRMLYRHPELPGLILQKYPDFDQTTYEAKSKLMQSFTSGSNSKEINAINAAMGHMKVLDDAVDAMNNGNVTVLNRIGNSLGINVTGQTAAAAFKTIVHRVGPEIAAAYIQGGGAEGERNTTAADFSENLPPQTLHNNAAITAKLLRSKVGSLENQYQNTVGRNDFQQRFITPEAQASFQKLSGGAGGGFSVKAPNGKIYSFKDQQSLDNFKKAANIQ